MTFEHIAIAKPTGKKALRRCEHRRCANFTRHRRRLCTIHLPRRKKRR